MTARERIMACYRRQPTDRSACAIYTRYLPCGEAEREERNLGMGVIDYVPPVTMMPPPWHMLTASSQGRNGREAVVRCDSHDSP